MSYFENYFFLKLHILIPFTIIRKGNKNKGLYLNNVYESNPFLFPL